MILQRIRFFLWSFAAVLVASAFLLATVNTAQTNQRLIEQSAHKDRVAAHQARVAAAERAKASAERERILQDQRDLEGKYDRLIEWLNAQGTVVPEEILTGKPSHDGHSGGGGSHSSSSSTGGSGKQSPSKSGPAANPVKQASGGSGKGHQTGSGHSAGHDKKHGGSASKGHPKAEGHKKH